MEFKNVENVGEGMLLDRERKKLRNIPAFFLLFFFVANIPGILFFLLLASSFSLIIPLSWKV